MVLRYQVPDMSCDHCVRAITKAVQGVAPTAAVQVDLAQHQVQVTGTEDGIRIEHAIREAGYSPTVA